MKLNFKTMLPWWGYAIAAIGLLAIGFFIGRANQKTIVKTEKEYVKGDTIRDSILVPKTKDSIIYKPRDVVQYLPSKSDTIWRDGKIVELQKNVDTSKIIAEYVKENRYSETLFDTDTSGKLVVNTGVQFNRQKYLSYQFTPVQKVVTNTVKKKNTFTPFIGASYNTLGYGGTGGGIFIKNVGFEYKYLTNLKGSNGHEGGIKIKF